MSAAGPDMEAKIWMGYSVPVWEACQALSRRGAECWGWGDSVQGPGVKTTGQQGGLCLRWEGRDRLPACIGC